MLRLLILTGDENIPVINTLLRDNFEKFESTHESISLKILVSENWDFQDLVSYIVDVDVVILMDNISNLAKEIKGSQWFGLQSRNIYSLKDERITKIVGLQRKLSHKYSLIYQGKAWVPHICILNNTITNYGIIKQETLGLGASLMHTHFITRIEELIALFQNFITDKSREDPIRQA